MISRIGVLVSKDNHMKKLLSFLSVASCYSLAAMNSTASWYPEQYREHSQMQRATALEILSTYQFDSNDKLLDIGCGDGWLTHMIASRVTSVLGIDRDENMIKGAQKEFGSKDNLTFKLLAAEQLGEFEEASFDHVTTFFCFQYVLDKQKAFKDIFRALKSGGRFLGVFSTKKADGAMNIVWQELFNKYKSLFSSQALQKHEEFIKQFDYTIDDYDKILAEAGFSMIDVEWQSRNFLFNDEEQFSKWVDAWAESYFGRLGLNNDDAKTVITFCKKTYLDKISYKSGKVSYPIETMVIKAKK